MLEIVVGPSTFQMAFARLTFLSSLVGILLSAGGVICSRAEGVELISSSPFDLNEGISVGKICEIGVTETSETRKILLWYENKFDHAVVVKVDSVSCSCLSFDSSSIQIEPGKRASLLLFIQAPCVAGVFSANANIDIAGQIYVIRFKGIADPLLSVEGVELRPIELVHPSFMNATGGSDTANFTVRVRDSEKKLDTAIELRGSVPGFRVFKVSPVEVLRPGQSSFNLGIQATEMASIGSSRLTLAIDFSGRSYALELPVRVQPWPLRPLLRQGRETAGGDDLVWRLEIKEANVKEWTFDPECSSTMAINGSYLGGAGLVLPRYEAGDKTSFFFTMIHNNRRFQLTMPTPVPRVPR